MDAMRERSTGSKGDGVAERRATVRRRVIRGATISFNKGFGALECVVRNESDGGVLLAFGETCAVPSAFDLKVNGKSARTARVRWRTMTLVGAEFVSGCPRAE